VEVRVPFSNQTTSREAAERLQGSASVITQTQRVLLAIEASGGSTDAEVAAATGMGIRQVSTRRKQLVEQGLVRESGRFREHAVGKRKFQNIVWEPGCDMNAVARKGPGTGRLSRLRSLEARLHSVTESGGELLEALDSASILVGDGVFTALQKFRAAIVGAR
jgi:hypothetical protein